MDYFLLNKKGLEEMSILPKIFCNMHIARCNMHIAIESILPLTHVRVSLIFAIIISFMLFTVFTLIYVL